MRVYLVNTKTNKREVANISKAVKKDLPFKKDGWNFNWRVLFKTEGSDFYKICLSETPDQIEGIIMITLNYGEMVFMNNVELAPHNIGKKKKYENIAGCLIAFACKDSFERGKNTYKGFLSFDSKTELIELYQNKYGAIWAMGQKMFFDPLGGKKLMREYLGLK